MVTYDVYAGYLIGELPYFLKTGETFVPRLAPVNLFYAGAGVGLKLPMGFGLQAGVRYDSYNNAGNFWSGRGGRVGMGIPEFTVTGRASYCYRDRFSVGISVEVLGERRFASLQNLDTAVPATVNLKVDAEYKTGPRFSIFAAGDNLLNRRIYRASAIRLSEPMQWREYGCCSDGCIRPPRDGDGFRKGIHRCS